MLVQEREDTWEAILTILGYERGAEYIGTLKLLSTN